MTGLEPYRYILIELEHPLDLGEPKQLRMICPTPEDVGLTFVSRDQAARAVGFTPFRAKRELPDRKAVADAVDGLTRAVRMAQHHHSNHARKGDFEGAVIDAKAALLALVYGEAAE